MMRSHDRDSNEEASYRMNTTAGKASSSAPESKSRKSKFSEEKEGNVMEEEEPSSSGVKKLDHNAKERIRRMKLNASYLSLRSLLPHSRRSKKRWSGPAIVDRVLKYIPELENEVEALRCKKENVVQTQMEIAEKNIHSNAKCENPTVSVNRVDRGEAVVQVCMAREEESQFTKLVQSVEDEGICIHSASTLDISETRICYHLHVQTNNTASEWDHQFEELKEKVISWLRMR